LNIIKVGSELKINDVGSEMRVHSLIVDGTELVSEINVTLNGYTSNKNIGLGKRTIKMLVSNVSSDSSGKYEYIEDEVMVEGISKGRLYMSRVRRR
jgi:hypothetical protein